MVDLAYPVILDPKDSSSMVGNRMAHVRNNDRVRVLACPARPDHVGKIGQVIKTPAVAKNPVLRVRFDDGTEVDGTAEKFERLGEPKHSYLP